jgi:hypothetical protein
LIGIAGGFVMIDLGAVLNWRKGAVEVYWIER